MTIRIAVTLIFSFLFFQSCLEEPEPIPENIITYHYYYNYLMEPYPVEWAIDDELLGTDHDYGMPAKAIYSLNQSEQMVLFQVKDADNGILIDSLSYTLYETGSYMIAILGTEEEPLLLCEQLDTHPPQGGSVKVQFLHTSPVLGPVDVYIGGNLSENKTFSGVGYSEITDYVDETEIDLWSEVTLTPAGILPADSTILSYTANSIFLTGNAYLCIIGHNNSSVESSYQIEVDEHPVY